MSYGVRSYGHLPISAVDGDPGPGMPYGANPTPPPIAAVPGGGVNPNPPPMQPVPTGQPGVNGHPTTPVPVQGQPGPGIPGVNGQPPTPQPVDPGKTTGPVLTQIDPTTGQPVAPGVNGHPTTPQPVGGTMDPNGIMQLLQGIMGQGGGASQAGGPMTPQYLSQLFPFGIPGSTPSQIGGLPTVNGQQLGAGPSTQQITSQIMNMLGPQFSQQNHALTESLANAGIVGGSTAGAVASLGNQQQSQALGQMAPYLMQGLGMQQARDFANQGTDLSSQQSNQQTGLQGSEFNASQQNASQQFDIENLIKSGMFDASNYNAMQQFLSGTQNQDWLALLNANASLGAQGAGATSGTFQPVYQQPSPVNLNGLASGLAPTSTIGGGVPKGLTLNPSMAPPSMPGLYG